MSDALIGVLGTVVGTVLGAFLQWFSTRKADEQARQRDRERDDRLYFRSVLAARFKRQRDAARAYQNLIEGGADALFDGIPEHVREQVFTAFEDDKLADKATEAARAFLKLPTPSVLDAREPRAYLQAMLELAKTARDRVEMPPMDNWRPAFRRGLKATDREIRDLARDIGLLDE